MLFRSGACVAELPSLSSQPPTHPGDESDGSSATQAPERRLHVKTSTALRDEAVRPPGRLTLERLAKSRPDDDRDHDDDREPREAHDAPRAPLPGPWRRLGHERIALRGRLAGEVVLALEHLRVVLDFPLLVHRDPFPFPYRADTVPQHSRPKVVPMRLLVAAAGLVSLLVLILPLH